ncbi:MAG: GTPase Era [Pseudomonadota bacterium]|nr:GTPase Era [Pseudomonadota bacterium]
MKDKYFISIVGKSNVGKSTLINYLCNQYITTESNKPQTTRLNILAETKIDGTNLILIDTPGLTIKDSNLLSATMKKSYLRSFENLDLVIILTDISKTKKFEQSILDMIDTNTKVMIVINKIDLLDQNIQEYKKYIKTLFDKKIFFISLKSKIGLDDLIYDGIKQELSIIKSADTNKFNIRKNELIAIQELIRGIIVNNTTQEIPYDSAVKINKSINQKLIHKIEASIFVEKINQRKILIGNNGNMIKLIGSKSRQLLEKKYNKKFYLKLDVCVKKGWKNNFSFLQEVGYL